MASPLSTDRSPDHVQTWASFVCIALIWGASFLFIKVALEDGVEPFTLVSLRALLGGLFLAVIMALRGGRLPRDRQTWWRLGVVGITNIVVPFTLITWGEQYIDTGVAGILNGIVPLFAVVLASLVLHDEPVTLARLGGLAVGFGGVVLLAWPSLSAAGVDQAGDQALMGMGAVALASLAYAVAAVYSRHRLTGQPLMEDGDGRRRPLTALEIAFGQILVAAVIMTILAVAFERPDGGIYAIPQSIDAVISVLWLGILGTGFAYLLFFRIIERWGATRATLVTYVMPVVAVVLGFIFLGERLQPIELAGTVLIIGGVVVVNARVGQRPLFGRSQAG